MLEYFNVFICHLLIYRTLNVSKHVFFFFPISQMYTPLQQANSVASLTDWLVLYWFTFRPGSVNLTLLQRSHVWAIILTWLWILQYPRASAAVAMEKNPVGSVNQSSSKFKMVDCCGCSQNVIQELVKSNKVEHKSKWNEIKTDLCCSSAFTLHELYMW